MIPELSIIKLLLQYNVWDKYKNSVDIKDIPKELQALYSVVNNYHAVNENKHDLTIADLTNLLLSNSYKDKDYYLGVIDNISSLDIHEETATKLIQAVADNRKLKEISLAAYDVTEGRLEKEKLVSMLNGFLEDKQENKTEEEEFITDDLQNLVDSVITTPGLRWRLKTLNKMMGSLRQGNFGFIFSRSETGKSTLIASETTFMAQQIPEGAGPIILGVNEEPGKTLKLRLYQAHFGIDLPTLLSDIPGWSEKYLQEMRGKIQIFDRAIISKHDIESICKRYKPSLLVLDAIDKIVGFEKDREDLRLGAIYQWARTLAKTYCPVIGVCQADGTAEGVKWLTMGHVDSAKTAKQKEADWILGVGKTHDAGYENLRYLHLSKNKLPGDKDTDPSLRHGKQEVLIEPMIARYKDIYE